MHFSKFTNEGGDGLLYVGDQPIPTPVTGIQSEEDAVNIGDPTKGYIPQCVRVVEGKKEIHMGTDLTGAQPFSVVRFAQTYTKPDGSLSADVEENLQVPNGGTVTRPVDGTAKVVSVVWKSGGPVDVEIR
jgi:hypothetical protein